MLNWKWPASISGLLRVFSELKCPSCSRRFRAWLSMAWPQHFKSAAPPWAHTGHAPTSGLPAVRPFRVQVPRSQHREKRALGVTLETGPHWVACPKPDSTDVRTPVPLKPNYIHHQLGFPWLSPQSPHVRKLWWQESHTQTVVCVAVKHLTSANFMKHSVMCVRCWGIVQGLERDGYKKRSLKSKQYWLRSVVTFRFP